MDISDSYVETTIMPLLGAIFGFAYEIGAIIVLSYLLFSIVILFDIVKRFSNETNKLFFYLLLCLVIPLGSFVYYFTVIPTDQRFIKQYLAKYKLVLFLIYSVLLLLGIVSSVFIYLILSS